MTHSTTNGPDSASRRLSPSSGIRRLFRRAVECKAAVENSADLAFPGRAGAIHGNMKARRDGREAEGGGLLNRYRAKSSIEGSNPSLSATNLFEDIQRNP
jgi:hypothetical protein